MTDDQFKAWASGSDAIRCVLAEVNALVGSTETTRYLSNVGYVTGSTDTPANTAYMPCIQGGVSVTECLPLDGSATMAWGDIEVANPDGLLDAWLNDVWSGRSVTLLIGDVRWPRSEFRVVFSGLIDDIQARSADTLNLLLRDKSERLNTSMSEALVGGTGPNKDDLAPLCFGEVHNVTPVLVDPGTLTYKVHNGPIESVIEVRDNGVPVGFGVNASNGTFTLTASPVGTITASVQGDKAGSVYRNTVGALVQHIAKTYGKDRLVDADLDLTQLAGFSSAHPQVVGLYLDGKENVLSVLQRLAASVGAQVTFTPGGLLQLQKVSLPAGGTPTAVGVSDMVDATLSAGVSPKVLASVRLAFCRNYTVQDGLQTGLPASHADLYAREWLVVQAKDQVVADRWKLSTTTDEVPTLLQVRSEAETEASRRLSLWSTRRQVLSYSGFGPAVLQPLGSAVTLTHSRFGLSGGKTGQVIGKKVDWLSQRVDFEVLT